MNWIGWYAGRFWDRFSSLNRHKSHQEKSLCLLPLFPHPGVSSHEDLIFGAGASFIVTSWEGKLRELQDTDPAFWLRWTAKLVLEGPVSRLLVSEITKWLLLQSSLSWVVCYLQPKYPNGNNPKANIVKVPLLRFPLHGLDDPQAVPLKYPDSGSILPTNTILHQSHIIVWLNT